MVNLQFPASDAGETMRHSYRLLLLGCLALGLLSGCGSSSYSSSLGSIAVATGGPTSGTVSPSTPGFNGPSIIPGTHDLVVATAEARNPWGAGGNLQSGRGGVRARVVW